MNQLRIGKADRKAFTLPVDVGVETSAVLGIRGTGKTYTAAVIVEELHERGVQVVIVDPTDAWWGLKASADGKKAGLPFVILGGAHGDLPLESGGGILADFAVENRVPMILSLRHLRKSAQRQMVTDFAEQLYHRKGEVAHRTPLAVVIDEASAFCLPDDTEILTENGWAGCEMLQEGMRVLAYNPASDTCQIESVQRVIRRHCDQECVLLKAGPLEYLCTPDHRVVMRRQQRAQGRYHYYDWTTEPASALPTSIQIPACRLAVGPGLEGLSSELCRIIGWVFTDGFLHDARKGDTIALEQSTATVKLGYRVADQMQEVLARHGASMSIRQPRDTKNPDGRVLHGRESYCWFFGSDFSNQIHCWIGSRLLPGEERRIPRSMIESCDRDQLQSLFLGLLEGDGTSRRGSWSAFYPGKNAGLADDFQEIATRLGHRCLKRWVGSIGQWVCRLNPNPNYWIRKPSRVWYRGKVWDITVPSGAFVARRDGAVFITGNCPQRVMGDSARMVGAIEDLVRRGRNAGLGVILVDQRPASVNKDVLSQLSTLVCHRISSPQDRKALDEWIRQHDSEGHREEFLEALASLPKGKAWFWSPSLDAFDLVQVRKRRTFDSSRTPEIGKDLKAPEKFADVDLDVLREQLAETLEEAEANDPKALKKRIAELEKELRSADPVVDQDAIDRAVTSAVAERDREWGERLKELQESTKILAGRLEQIAMLAHVNGEVPVDVEAPEPVKVAPAPAGARQAAPRSAGPRMSAPWTLPDRPTSTTGLKPALQRIIDALAWLESVGVYQHQRSVVAALAGASPKSSAFANNISALRAQHGFIDYPGEGLLALTDEGRAAANAPRFPPTLEELHAAWMNCGALKPAHQRILQAVLDVYPDSISREVLASAAGASPTSSAFANNVSRLSSMKLIRYPSQGFVIANRELLYPEGLR